MVFVSLLPFMLMNKDYQRNNERYYVFRFKAKEGGRAQAQELHHAGAAYRPKLDCARLV